MPVLDFKEIPEAHKGGGVQDTFELFARDFFELLGYHVVRGPSRGADGGCDLILEETRTGIAGSTKVKWLVSCKHKAHSGASVLKTDEAEVRDSVESNKCQGFIGFYSTLASSGLLQKVQAITSIQHQFFDSSRIEQMLLVNPEGHDLAKRYFPTSYSNWITENPKKAQLFSGTSGLKCAYCGKDITEGDNGIVVSWERYKNFDKTGTQRDVKDFYCCCKGDCDRQLKHRYAAPDYMDKWKDIHDLRIPTVYIRWIMGTMNQLNGDCPYSPEAFNAKKEILLELFPYVARNLTMKEIDRLKVLGEIPSFLGGFGYEI